MIETVKRDTYNDATYTIERTDEHENTKARGYHDHEFVLSVEGERVTNAKTLEMEGFSNGDGLDSQSASEMMTRYAKAFIDGASSGLSTE